MVIEVFIFLFFTTDLSDLTHYIKSEFKKFTSTIFRDFYLNNCDIYQRIEIKQAIKRLNTTVVNAPMMRRRRHQGFKDLIEQASIRLYTTTANAYTRRRRIQ